eukprot:TRINITY_DN99336_c0_g1_i1.p1 TRINITY_DN99336_c0_g1~~TRINITY_DN99336_c0_g1_i1.p1  ORF type:complete len:121 (-),score=38.47 TRINITY_DN99336_c0_g1_i1:86-448(-)
MALLRILSFMLLPSLGAALAHATVGTSSMNEVSLHEQMKTMMTDDDAGSGFMDMADDDGTDDGDPYMQEAADGLSRALGPRWNKDYIEADANRKTAVLMKGIGGQENALKGVNQMMGALR